MKNWLNKLWFIHTMAYSAEEKRIESFLCANMENSQKYIKYPKARCAYIK